MKIRRAKIIATLGPSSNTVEIISELIRAGVNVTRINMSHGTHESHAELIANVRQASKNVGRQVAVLADLQGPKIRTDKLPNGLDLKKGEIWVIGQTKHEVDYPEYKGKFIPTIYDKLVDDCHDGARILFDDGKIVAQAIERDRNVYKIEVINGGELKSNKGINLPDCDVSAPAFTRKDEEDLMFALKQGIDLVALSFVRKKEDIMDVKGLLHRLKMNVPIISKIEKPQAIDNLEEILKVTDFVMVARGDMGVEVGNHLVPSIQKKIITLCNDRYVPVITATQMLETMTDYPTPTRAEASDVANAVWDGTDALMLSGETANGKYPVLAVKMMSDIIIEAEKTPKERPLLRNLDLQSVNSAIMVAASMVAEKVDAKRILALTESGNSVRRISVFRPKTPVVAITTSVDVARRACLYWGVYPYLSESMDENDVHIYKKLMQEVKTKLRLVNGDRVVITRGDGQFFNEKSSNSVKVEIIKGVARPHGKDETLEVVSDAEKSIQLDREICATCQSCVSICPHDIWASNPQTKETHLKKENIGKCAMDMECVRVCPTGAIEIIPSFK